MTGNTTMPTMHAWLDDLASDAPAPGGGAAAALCGALSGALVSMVARFALKRPMDDTLAIQARSTLEASESLRIQLEHLVSDDAEAFEMVAAAYRLPKSTNDERSARKEAIQRALVVATDVPLQIAHAAREIITLAQTVAAIGPRSVITDAGAAAILAQAAIRAALLNVDANLATMRDPDLRERCASEIAGIRQDLEDIVDQVLARVAERQA